jgi:hypothetical protein
MYLLLAQISSSSACTSKFHISRYIYFGLELSHKEAFADFKQSRASQHSVVSHPSISSHKSVVSHFAPQETKATSVDACTPGPKPHVPFSECKSEPRGVGFATPQLRSVRGLSITSHSDAVVATDPVRNKEKSESVTNWLESTPTNNIQSLSLEEATETIKRHQQRSPPKMPSLFSQGGNGGTLTLKVRRSEISFEFAISHDPWHIALIPKTSLLHIC